MATQAWARWAIGCCGVVVLGGTGLVLFAVAKVASVDRTWESTASIEIAAPADAIRPLLESPRRWSEWSAWARDSATNVRREYSGPDGGAGAQMRWSSVGVAKREVVAQPAGGTELDSEDVGAGVLRIVDSTPERVTVETAFRDRAVFASRSVDGRRSGVLSLEAAGLELRLRGEIELDPRSDATVVTWRETGDFGAGFFAGVLALTVRAIAGAGHDELLESSLARLKRAVELR